MRRTRRAHNVEIHRAYFPALPASTFYSVRMITGGTTAATAATACHANTIGPTVQTSFSIATGSEDTFAAYGSPAVPSLLRAATLQDSTGRPGDGTIMVRLFNAATSVPVIDSGYNVGGSWVMGTSGTPYGSVHLDSVNTSLGLTLLPGAHYVGNIPLIGPVDIGAFASGMLGADGGLPVATGMADCDAAASLSLYVVLQSDAALQIIECDDTQPIWMSPTSQRSSCAALPMP